MLESNRNKIRMACHEKEQIAHNVVTLKSKSTSVHVEYEGSSSANITKQCYYDKWFGIALGFLNCYMIVMVLIDFSGIIEKLKKNVLCSSSML